MKIERVNVPIRYKVRGLLAFPIDMLRYDSAWPASEHDSNTIEHSVTHNTNGPAEVVVYARQPLTIGRWKSFGWEVIGVVDDFS